MRSSSGDDDLYELVRGREDLVDAARRSNSDTGARRIMPACIARRRASSLAKCTPFSQNISWFLESLPRKLGTSVANASIFQDPNGGQRLYHLTFHRSYILNWQYKSIYFDVWTCEIPGGLCSAINAGHNNSPVCCDVTYMASIEM